MSKYIMIKYTHYCDSLTRVKNYTFFQYQYNSYKLSILMQGGDIEVNPGPTTGKLCVTAVQASFHQGDHKKFHERSVGKQCVTNSIIAIIYSTRLPIKYWEPKHLDEILRIGDRFYRRINSPHDYLLISDIPDIVTEFGENYTVTRSSEMFGSVVCALHDRIGQELGDAIKSMIQEDRWTSVVLCVGQASDTSLHSRAQGGSACALMVTKNNFYVFDPHSRDGNGKATESGVAVLLHFTTIKQCCRHIKELCYSLNCNYYEITIVNISNLLLTKYMTDQKRKQAQKQEATINNQMSSHTQKQGKRE